MSEYEGREQSRAKHEILRGYLARFAHIIGTWKSAITYVDCFSGPWEEQTADLSDTSFVIAIEELRKARNTLKLQRGKDLALRCFFIEKDESSFAKLKAYIDKTSDVEIEIKNSRLEDAIADILRFVNSGGVDSFPFFLIDPKGWTGFELDVITPLLQHTPGEVLINFMTSFIRRFIKWEDPENQAGFNRTFGQFRPKREDLLALAEEDLDDLLVASYAKLLKEVGHFSHVCSSIILDPEKDSTHFHLIYATRDLKGLKAFKDEEPRAMKHHEDARAQLRGAKIERKSGQSLFGPQAFGTRHFDTLRARYLAKARRKVVDALNSSGIMKYEDAFAMALTYPLVWEKDLKDWIRSWQLDEAIELTGLKRSEKVPKLRKGHALRVLRKVNH